jgi:hypothetical protein
MDTLLEAHIESFNKKIKDLKKGTTSAIRKNDSSPLNKYMYTMSNILGFDVFLAKQGEIEQSFYEKSKKEVR